MKLFPSAIISWNEPDDYFHASSPRFALVQITVTASITMVFLFYVRNLPIGVIVIILFCLGILFALPWINAHWPRALRLSGHQLTLFDDRITRYSAQTPEYLWLNKIRSCSYEKFQSENAKSSYWILRFNVESSFIESWTETAVADPRMLDQVVQFLRNKEILVTELPSGE